MENGPVELKLKRVGITAGASAAWREADALKQSRIDGFILAEHLSSASTFQVFVKFGIHYSFSLVTVLHTSIQREVSPLSSTLVLLPCCQFRDLPPIWASLRPPLWEDLACRDCASGAVLRGRKRGACTQSEVSPKLNFW